MNRFAGKYQIIRLLGEGAHGRVYLGQHQELGNYYALKILRQVAAKNPETLARFKREAELLSKFSHPGSVQLRDFGCTTEGEYFMATDYCTGVSLSHFLELNKSLSPARALELIIPILDVLQAAHSIGITHRDVKPQNIIVDDTEDGTAVVKLVDFGVAKLCGSMLSNPVETIYGLVMGTPQYMSPEQATGEVSVDCRSDIFSTAVILYELLTGEIPFEAETTVQTLMQVITKAPVPFAQKIAVPIELERIVFKALEKDRSRRFQSAEEFRLACLVVLEEIKSGDWRTPTASLDTFTANTSLPTGGQKPLEIEEGAVLCVDDDPLVLDMLRYLLKKAGYIVYTASDCAEIHNYLTNGNVKNLICDLQMPGLSGVSVCRQIKLAIPQIKILLLSGAEESTIALASEVCGASGWIRKSSSPSEWLRQILEVMPPARGVLEEESSPVSAGQLFH